MKRLIVPLLIVAISVSAGQKKLSPFPVCNIGSIKLVEMYQVKGGFFIDDDNATILETNVDTLANCVIEWIDWAQRNGL